MHHQQWLAVVNGFDQSIKRHGLSYTRWYVGIAKDLQDRVEGDHRVKQRYYYHDFGDDDLARRAERYFHDRGCKGSHGGGDHNTTILYAYLITPDTVEEC